jgi:hypothetical protein
VFKELLQDFAKKGVPDALVLLKTILWGDPDRFRQISEDGATPQRLAVTAALGFACVAGFAFSGYIAYVFNAEKMGLFPADGVVLVGFAVLIGGIVFLALRLFSRTVIPLYAVNVSLATAALLTLVPSIIFTIGLNVSPQFHLDFNRLKAGQGYETGVYDYYCGTLERRAEWTEVGRLLAENNRLQADHIRRMQALTAAQLENHREMVRLTPELKAAANDRSPHPKETPLDPKFTIPLERSLALGERGLVMVEEGLRLAQNGLTLGRRGLDLEIAVTAAPLILIRAYPVLAFFFLLGFASGVFIWFRAGRLVWLRLARDLTSRLHRLGAGILVTTVLLGIVAGVGVVASGLLDISVGREPNLRTVVAELRYEFKVAEPYCGTLNKHDNW